MKVIASAIAVALLAVLGCKGEPPPGPKTADYAKERQALMSRLAKKQGRKRSPAKAVPAKASASLEASFGTVEKDFAYEATGRRDPFRSFEWERSDQFDELANRGPLEQFDVDQLELVAVVWNTGGARALVQDPSGQSYIIGAGAQIGKNRGRVIKIDDNLVVVRETYVDFLGQETTKEIEMRIRGDEGGELHAGIH